MPSFFESMKRMMQGKPVFDESDHDDDREGNQWEEEKPAALQEPVQPEPHLGPKVLPLVTVQRVECRLDDDKMDVDFFIRNDSHVSIELDKIRILKTEHQIDDHLRPGEQREFRVYDDVRPHDTYSDECELVYKDETGDYFSARHHMEFQRQNDGSYIVWRVRFIPPVRDV